LWAQCTTRSSRCWTRWAPRTRPSPTSGAPIAGTQVSCGPSSVHAPVPSVWGLFGAGGSSKGPPQGASHALARCGPLSACPSWRVSPSPCLQVSPALLTSLHPSPLLPPPSPPPHPHPFPPARLLQVRPARHPDHRHVPRCGTGPDRGGWLQLLPGRGGRRLVGCPAPGGGRCVMTSRGPVVGVGCSPVLPPQPMLVGMAR
jgi:hypothetical protein